ncbi:MAG: rod shape-determining protein MreC [Clostridia bacterium]|nr:rod shape-determining protein MreC [Clostridia bacterium]
MLENADKKITIKKGLEKQVYKNKKVGIIGIAITAIILIILVLSTSINVNKFSVAEGFLNKLVMPIQNGLTYLKNKISKNNAFFEDINSLKQENAELIEENKQLEERLRELEIIKAENSTLRAYNNMSEKYAEYQTVPAYIINKDISNLSNTMIINIGRDNGIDINMPVITTEGLVGYTISVTDKTAKVKPIIDASSSISSAISTSRDSVIVKGVLRKHKYFKTNVYSNRGRFSIRRYN